MWVCVLCPRSLASCLFGQIDGAVSTADLLDGPLYCIFLIKYGNVQDYFKNSPMWPCIPPTVSAPVSTGQLSLKQ